MSRFSGKKAVISGGTHGMGFAIAKALLDGGADVLLTGRNERNIDAAREALPGAHVVRTDTASLSDIAALGSVVEVKGIRVNAVGPGFIDTPTLGVAGLTPEARLEMAKLGDQVTPMKRHGAPEEVARAAVFLAADATFTTGIELAVDGGLMQIGVAL